MGWEAIEEMSVAALPDELSALFVKERQYQHQYHQCHQSNQLLNGNGNGDDMASHDSSSLRRSVCQWNYECVDYFLFDRHVVHLSMNYFDRYLASYRRHHPDKAMSTMLTHLVALSSLYLACKLHGERDIQVTAANNNNTANNNNKLTLQDFCLMSRNTYCPQMLEEMELSLLTSLAWMVNPPTPMDFIMRFVKILATLLSEDYPDHVHHQHDYTDNNYITQGVDKAWSVFEVARYQTELAVYCPQLSSTSSSSSSSSLLSHDDDDDEEEDYELHFTPSKIALAAILNAMDSKIVATKQTVISTSIRNEFLEKVMEEYFIVNLYNEDDNKNENHVDDIDIHCHIDYDKNAQDLEDSTMTTVQEARSILKKLCSKTIVLPAVGAAASASANTTAATTTTTTTTTNANGNTINSNDADCDTSSGGGSSSSIGDSGATSSSVSSTSSYELPEIHAYVNNSIHRTSSSRSSSGAATKRRSNRSGSSPVCVTAKIF